MLKVLILLTSVSLQLKYDWSKIISYRLSLEIFLKMLKSQGNLFAKEIKWDL